MKKWLPYLAVGALIYWFLLNRQQGRTSSPGQVAQLTPDQIAYAKSLPSDLYL